jgi:hypothetical protein
MIYIEGQNSLEEHLRTVLVEVLVVVAAAAILAVMVVVVKGHQVQCLVYFVDWVIPN